MREHATSYLHTVRLVSADAPKGQLVIWQIKVLKVVVFLVENGVWMFSATPMLHNDAMVPRVAGGEVDHHGFDIYESSTFQRCYSLESNVE